MIRLARAAPTTAFAGVLTALLLSTSGCSQPDDTDTIVPDIRFTFPSEGVDLLDDIATIRVEARDAVGIKQVIFMAEGDTLAGLAGLTYTDTYTLYWNTTAYPDCTDADSYVLLAATAEDFAGNSRSTHRKFYLDNEGNPPIPVELFTPTNVTKHSVTLSWEQSVDYDFSHYLLRRDVTSDVTGASDSLVLIDERNTTSFTDQDTIVSPFGLLENTNYYYCVWVYDVFDSSSASDSVVSVRTLLPRPVTLSATSTITKYKIELEWTPSTEDVAYYRLHRGPSPLKANLDSIAVFFPEGTPSFIDTGRTAYTTYYYYLYLFDEAGYTHTFRSDGVLEVRTLALPPPVLEEHRAITKYSATIAWETIAEQEDSSWVALYRGTGATVDASDVLLYTAPRNEANEAEKYTDSGLQQGGTYRYRLHHRDSQDNTAWGNTLALTTRTLDDVWSGGLGVSSQGKYQLGLTWDRYNYSPPDFASYTLSRAGQVIFTSTNAGSNSYEDTGLSLRTTYTYLLTVSDTSGASVMATLDASTRDILPAEIVILEATDDWFYYLAWLPSAEPDAEFDRYELLRSPDASVTFADDYPQDNTADCLLSGNCLKVATFTERQPIGVDTLTYLDSDPTLVAITPVDTTLVDTTLPIYNYVVLTYDLAGEYAPSNIDGETLYAPPTPVALSVPCPGCSEEAIGLEWTRARWPSPGFEAILFSRYEVWRYELSGQQPWNEGPTEQMVAFFTDIDKTSFSDAQNLGQQRDWFYVVVVRDIFGQGAVSNEVMGWTKL